MKRAYKIQEFVAHTGNVNCVKIGKKTSRVLVTGGEDSKVNMWAVGKPNPILSLSGHSSAVESVTFDVTESLVVAGAASGTIKLWDLEEARIVRTLTGHRSNCTALDFHPFGEFFASGSLDTNLKVWDVRRKGCIHTYKGHTKGVNSVRFSPDGRWVVSGGEDNVVKLWDLTAGKLIHEFKHHDGQVQCLDFHPQEFLLATGSADRTVKFVDLETFATIGCAGPEPTGVRSLVFHPDGQTVLYGLHETLKVYSWEPLRCHDVVEVGWSKLADLSISEGKLLGCSYNQSCVGVWVVDLAHVAPHGAGVARGFGSPRSSFSFRSPKLLTSRDLQQVGEGITRMSVDREQPSEQVKEVTKVTTGGRDHLSHHAADGLTRQNSATRSQQVDDGGIRLSISKEMKTRDLLVQQEPDDTSKLSASKEFPVQQVRNGAEKLSRSRDGSTKLLVDGGNIVYSSNEFIVQQVSDRGKIMPGSREQSTQQPDEEVFSKGRSHHPQPGEDAKVVHVTEEATVQVNQEVLKDVAHQQTTDDEKHPVTGRDCTVQQGNDGGSKVASTREHLFPEPGTRLSISKDNSTEQANDGGSKMISIREQLFHEPGTRLSTGRDHQTQPANGNGNRVSSIKELLFPERPNNSRDHAGQQASDGGVKVSSIRETLFPDSGNRLNNRDHVPRHLGTGDVRKPSDVIVKRPVAFEVMNSSPRVSQMDSFKPATPTRGIVKVEDHNFLIGGARSALSKGSPFQNGGKGFGADADAFGNKGNRLERTNSFGENGLKPLGLDMNAFAPKGSLTDRSDASVNDVDLIKELMQQHQTVSSILLSRLTNMQVVQRFLARDDLKGAAEALAKVADPSVLIEVVNVLMAKCDSFTLEICSILLPSINQLLTSEHEKYLLTGVALLSMLVTSFGTTIHSTRVAPPAVGVDLEAERRQECCKVCYEKLLSIRQSLVPLTRRGGQLAKTAHDLSTSLDEI